MGRKRHARLSRLNRISARQRELAVLEEGNFVPQSLVITRGKVSPSIRKLASDFRSVMEPNTAVRLSHTDRNKIKDFLAVSTQFNITHLIIFSQTEIGMHIKYCRLPNGPTMTFRIVRFASGTDVLSTIKKHNIDTIMYQNGPFLMTNLQPENGDNHLQLAARMFLDLFPTIKPDKAKTKNIRRCCLMNYDPETEVFDFRHYSIRVVPVGIAKAIKKVKSRKLPDLSSFNDVSEFMTKAGIMSDSEGEEDPSSQVTVPSKGALGKAVPQKSSVRLTELGPRLTLKLIKIESGLLEGTILYHSIVNKTDEEKLELEKQRHKKRKEKEFRKMEQEANIEAKKKKLEDHKKKCLGGMGLSKKKYGDDDEWQNIEADDDAQYYRDEVGQEPDEDMFSNVTPAKKRKSDYGHPRRKMMKADGDKEGASKTDKKRSTFKRKEGSRDNHNNDGTSKKKEKKVREKKHQLRRQMIKAKKFTTGKTSKRKAYVKKKSAKGAF